MLWPVFSWEVRLDHCNGPSRSLAQGCLISFPTLSCTEKRKFKRNKSGSKILHILNIAQDYQPSAEVFRGRSSARGRSSINWQKLMKLCLVFRTELALVWEIAVAPSHPWWACKHSYVELSLCVWFFRSWAAEGSAWESDFPSFDAAWGDHSYFPVPAAVSWQWSGAAMPCVSPPWVIFTSWNPFSTLRTKALNLCAQLVMIIVHWMHGFVYVGDSSKCRTLFGNFFSVLHLRCSTSICPGCQMLPGKMSSPVRSRKMSTPWLHRYWLSKTPLQVVLVCGDRGRQAGEWLVFLVVLL